MYHDERDTRNLVGFIVKILLIIVLNVHLIVYGVLRCYILDITLFNCSVLVLWFGWYVRTIRKIYKGNCGFIPTIASSVAADHPLRFENMLERRKALRDAVRGIRWHSFNW